MSMDLRGDLLRDSQVERMEPGLYSGCIPEAWRVFHAFGGMTFAVALRAIEAEIADPQLRPLSATALFVSPVPCGPVAVSVRMLHRGKSAAMASAELRVPSAEFPAVCVQAAFGARRPSEVALDRLVFPGDLTLREHCKPYTGGPRLAVSQQCEWVRQLDLEPALGGRLLAWNRYHVPPRLPDGRIDPISHVLCADNLILAIMAGLPQDTPLLNLLTLRLDVEFFDDTQRDWTLQVVRALRVADGYAHGTVELWDEDRTLIAVASQRARCSAFPGTRAAVG
jgi:acyl-CoA thioesterase